MSTAPSEGTESDPRLSRTYRMTIVAQDPSVTGADGSVLLAQIEVPADALTPGPRSHRFHVVDYDPSAGGLAVPTVLTGSSEGPPFGWWRFRDAFPLTKTGTPKPVKPAELRNNHDLHAQNVYAIAAKTLATFQFALGRRIPWAFGDHQLYLVPHALPEANAYYSETNHAVVFGSFTDENNELVHTALSHDIVAHETTHAVLDGLRTRFDEPSLPDQDAFHEGFADVVALLSVFALPGVVEHLLGTPAADGTIPAGAVSEEALRQNALFALAEQMGSVLSRRRGSALRRSIELEPGDGWRKAEGFEEPHRRGEVVAAAFMQTLLCVWLERLKPLTHDGHVDRDRAAEEGSKAAEHLLTMAIRAIDYSPPVELEFEDVVSAIVWSDAVVVPEDTRGYRQSVIDGFSRFGVAMNPHVIIDLSRVGGDVVYQNLNFASMHHSRDEIFAFIWNNAEWLKIDRQFRIHVESVKPATRVGPDGLVVHEIIADYVQTVEGSAADVSTLGLKIPAGLPGDTPIQMWGGGTLIFDQFGRAKFHVCKSLIDWDRQGRRLEYLIKKGLRGRDGGFGFSVGMPLGQRFAVLHSPDRWVGEQW